LQRPTHPGHGRDASRDELAEATESAAGPHARDRYLDAGAAALTLAAGERTLHAAAVDPSGEFAYFGGTIADPGRLVKVRIGAPAAADYTPLPPVRVLDTRNHTQDDISAPVGRRQTVTQTVAGIAGVPADASTVAINITAVGPTQAGYLTVWPSGQPRPQASSINFAADDIVGNFVIAEVGTGGKLDIYNHNGQVDLVFDLVGYFPPQGG
jgi:hypothetical protein